MPGEAQQEFDRVREIFFPRWDRARRWRCRRMGVEQRIHGDGLCVPSRRAIYIHHRVRRSGGAQLTGVIIHEICHAIEPRSSHGKSWRERMSRAAGRAEALGENDLARWLREEVHRYLTPPGRLRVGATYGEIRDFVAESGKVPSFRKLVEEFSRSRGMKPGEFLRRYPRARAVYDAGVRRRGAGFRDRGIAMAGSTGR